MLDLISIIVPVYNASAYLDQCIKSILKQTIQHIEIILVDDGSTDSSGLLCDVYQQMDRRIRVLHQNNGGSVSARKAGLNIANGKYIGFVDSDDYIEADMYQRLYSKIKEYQVDFVHSGMITGNEKICNYEEGVVELSAIDKAEFISKNLFLSQTMSYSLWSKLFKAELIKDAFMCLPNEQSYGEDLLCLCSYILKCNRFYMLKEAFYHYRIHDGSLSHRDWLELGIEEAKLYSHIMQFLKVNGLLNICGDSVKKRYKRRILQAMEIDPSNGIEVLHYLLPNSYIEKIKGKKVVLYGAGAVGKDFYGQIVRENSCVLAAWVDGNNIGNLYLITVERPEILKSIDFDIIILAVYDENTAEMMKNELRVMGIENLESKVLWMKPDRVW